MFEDLLINHCAPTLAGIKPANLFTYQGNDAREMVEKYNFLLEPYNIHLSILRYHSGKYLIYLYRVNMIEKILDDSDVENFLKEYSYRNFSLNSCLSHLSKRLCNHDFPHEIGIFLGYPLKDVEMFIKNRGKNYKVSGVWKVYFDEKKSVETFKSYKDCISDFISRFENGTDIADMCVA